jgi:uncharacterized cupredoxin-like copper-binding protein
MRRVVMMFVLAALTAVGLGAGIFVASGGASPAAGKRSAKASVTVVATEFKFKLSKRTVSTGLVVLRIVNRGKITHNFKIAGKKTPTLLPGQSAVLRVTFRKRGRYAYVCTLPGHASAGMKGSLAVGVKPTSTSTRTTTTTTTSTSTSTTTSTSTSTTTGTVGGGNTTVQVGMFEYRFDLSQTTVPSGQVTFVITNNGREVHNFDITGVKAGAIIGPGQSETWTVPLPAGNYGYVCDVPFHAGFGMTGSLTVTP